MDEYKNKKLLLEDGREVDIPMRDDGYIMATKMCKSANKQLQHWRDSPSTRKFTDLVKEHTNLTYEQLIIVKRGGNDKNNQGTWIHPKLAIHLAMWLSSSFCLQVSNWIEEWCSYKRENYHEFLYEIYNLECDEYIENNKEKVIQLRLHQELGGEIEVETAVGFIDLLTKDEIIEIKEGRNWKHAVGQILMYGIEYPSHNKRIHLFDMEKSAIVEDHCKFYNVSVSYES